MVQINCNLTLKAGKIRLQHHCNGSLNSRGWCIKFATHKWPLQLTKVHFMTISSRFFANYFDIFHKTEVQTVILKWWTGLNLNWLKSYDTNRKYFHFNPSHKFNAPPYSTIQLIWSDFSDMYFWQMLALSTQQAQWHNFWLGCYGNHYLLHFFLQIIRN